MVDKKNVVLPPLQRCENCRFWQEFDFVEGCGHTGECVRHPPVFIGLDEEEQPQFAQPFTGIYATCGEWCGFVLEKQPDGRVAEGPFRPIFPAEEEEQEDEVENG